MPFPRGTPRSESCSTTAVGRRSPWIQLCAKVLEVLRQWYLEAVRSIGLGFGGSPSRRGLSGILLRRGHLVICSSILFA